MSCCPREHQSSLPRSIFCSRNSHIPTQRKFLMKTGTGFGRSRQPSEEVWAGGRQSALHQLHHHRQLCFWRNLLFKTSREMIFHSSLYVYDYSCYSKWNVEGNFAPYHGVPGSPIYKLHSQTSHLHGVLRPFHLPCTWCYSGCRRLQSGSSAQVVLDCGLIRI